MWLEIVVLIFTIFILWQFLKKPSNYPPGPWGLPLIGYISFEKNTLEQKFINLRKKHGDIISWRFGTQLIVILFDYKDIKEAFLGQNIADRPSLKVFTLIAEGKPLGVVGSNGVHWHSIRRFSLRHLRDLGMGKSRLSTAIQYEASEFVKEISKQAGKPAPLSHTLIVSTLNVVWQMVASKRFNLNDEEILDFDKSITDIQESLGLMAIPEFFPWLKSIFPKFLLNKFLKESRRIEVSKKFVRYLQNFVDEHKKNLDPDDPKDLIDAYLIEMEKQKSDPTSVMSEEDLVYLITDLFGAGSETVTNTIRWATLYLASFPKVQVRLQKEIDEVLPKGNLATLEDKLRLPYTEAFLHEVLRYSSLANIGLLHLATADVNLGSYLIPKNALVMNCTTCHFDPKFFSSPNEFRPEAYINSDGKFEAPKDGFIPFGIGRRQCLGESLARMELLIFITTLVQNFNFAAPPGKTLDLRPKDTIPFLNMPKSEQDLLITNR